jgi:hypothetical protein
MSPKLDRLHTPQAYENIKEAYRRMTILEVASEFRTSHETIRKILIKNGVRIRKKGEHTDTTKIDSAAYSATNIIRKYPVHLHQKILNKIKQYIL